MQVKSKKEQVPSLGLAVSIALLACACTEFATPAELSRAQVLAISAEPPAVPPAETTTLTILVADSDGPIATPDVSWTVTPLRPGDVPLGEVASIGGVQATYRAPPEIAETPAFDAVQTSVQIDPSSPPLIAIKAIVIGDLPLFNPTLSSFTVGDIDALTSDSITLSRGERVALAITTESVDAEGKSVAWYSTVGTIERYQSTPADMVVSDEPGSGWLIVVARDGLGGVVWREVVVTVE